MKPLDARLYAIACFGLIICPAGLLSIANNYLGAKGGMKLAEAFAKMPKLPEVKCVLAPHAHTALP